MSGPRSALMPLAPYGAVLVGLHGFSNAWVTVGLYHLAIVLFIALENSGGVAAAVRSGWEARSGTLLVLVCAAGGISVALLWPAVRLEGLDLRSAAAALGLEGPWFWVFGIYFSTAGVVLEEVFWRFSLTAQTPLPHWRDAAFAGYHGLVLVYFLRPIWIAAALLILFGIAWMWRITANRTGGLLVPIASHAAADLGVVLALALLLAARG